MDSILWKNFYVVFEEGDESSGLVSTYVQAQVFGCRTTQQILFQSLNLSPNFPLVFVLCSVKLDTCTVLNTTDFPDFDYYFNSEKQTIF